VNPNIAYLLLMFGFYGLLFEVNRRGFGASGMLGILLILAALGSMRMLPVNLAGLGWIVLGMILFAAEIKRSGSGWLTVGGLIALLSGSLFLFDLRDELLCVSYAFILPLTAGTAALTLLLVRFAAKTDHHAKAALSMEALVGEIGELREDVSREKEGKVFVRGELWNAASKSEIKKGAKVMIVRFRGMLLEVELPPAQILQDPAGSADKSAGSH